MKFLSLFFLFSASVFAVNTQSPSEEPQQHQEQPVDEQTIFDTRAEKAKENLEKMKESEEAIEQQQQEPQVNQQQDFEKDEGSVD